MVSAEMSAEVGTLDVTTKREKMTQGGSAQFLAAATYPDKFPTPPNGRMAIII
jgi:hypothetical protein